MTLISYMKTATNKQLFISDSHDDSNRCTSCRGKLDQHDMYASHVSLHTPDVCFLQQFSYVSTFHELSTDLDKSHCFREKGLPT
jgi:hypothetical protein